MGAPLRGILEKNLKPVQMKELDDEWGKMGSGEPAVPNRRLRSQQVNVVKGAIARAKNCAYTDRKTWSLIKCLDTLHHTRT